jgi:hypothetical protein
MKTISKHTDHIRIVNGDLFDHVGHYVRQGNNGTSVIVPHVCNNINLFGAGFAAGVAKHYPIVKQNYHLLGSQSSLGYVQFVEVDKDPTYGHKLIFANMIAQNGVICNSNPRPLNYYALTQCMVKVAKFIQTSFDPNENKAQIHAPKFGCGLAGGDWSFIQELIKDIWGRQTVLVYQK